jgi:hypothetical protein
MGSLWIASAGVAGIVLAGSVGTALRFRARSAKQWRTTWDAYAEREITERRRRLAVQRSRAFFTLVRSPVAIRSLPTSREVVNEERT